MIMSRGKERVMSRRVDVDGLRSRVISEMSGRSRAFEDEHLSVVAIIRSLLSSGCWTVNVEAGWRG